MMRLAALLSLLLSLGITGLWLAHGRHMATLKEKPVEKIVIDEFGDEEKVIIWEPTFELGLDIAGPLGTGTLLLGGLLLFLDHRRRLNSVIKAASGS